MSSPFSQFVSFGGFIPFLVGNAVPILHLPNLSLLASQNVSLELYLGVRCRFSLESMHLSPTQLGIFLPNGEISIVLKCPTPSPQS